MAGGGLDDQGSEQGEGGFHGVHRWDFFLNGDVGEKKGVAGVESTMSRGRCQVSSRNGGVAFAGAGSEPWRGVPRG